MATRIVMAPGWLDHIERVTSAVVASVAADIASDANASAPRDSGDLAGSYIWRWSPRRRRLSARIGSHLGYGTVVELGGRPHIIRARRKKALRFSIGGPFGPFLFRKVVNHPGQAAQPHLRPALWTRRVIRRPVGPVA